MKGKKIYLLFSLALAVSCHEPVEKKSSIVLGDSSTIVTENNSKYLQNQTADISPISKKSSEGEISKMMTQLDSAHSVKKLEEQPSPAPIKGFTIRFAEGDVVFEGLSAHAININQDERSANSVSYVWDAGNLDEMVLDVKGLSEVKVEQRTFTRLSVDNGEEMIVLNDLGKFISPWFTLPTKTNRFISLSSNSHQFFAIDNKKIVNALDRELRKKHKSREDIKTWMGEIKRTQTYSDPPCKLILASSQWRVMGMQDGKRIQKLIQFDIPL
jgi:hypothetical protein